MSEVDAAPPVFTAFFLFPKVSPSFCKFPSKQGCFMVTIYCPFLSLAAGGLFAYRLPLGHHSEFSLKLTHMAIRTCAYSPDSGLTPTPMMSMDD